jgi:hypothetical protein
MNIEWTDFAVINAAFVMTLVTLFHPSIKQRAGQVAHYVLLGGLTLYVWIILYFPRTLETKIFATLMLISALIMELLMWKQVHNVK